MARFVLKRILWFPPVLWVIITVVFFLTRLAPGGPFDAEKSVAPEVREYLAKYYGLSDPLYLQYFHYLCNVARGDLGPSFSSTFTVNERIAEKFPVSLELGVYALLFALVLGLATGILAAWRPRSWLDHSAMSLALIGISVPSLVLGPLLVLIFSLWLGWFDVAGWSGGASKVLPSITLGASYAAYVARLCRSEMIETLSQDFIRTARAKGLSEPRVLLGHALRGGIQPVVSYLGPAAAGLLTGSFVVEQVFNIPGLGTEFVRAASNRDYTMVLGTVVFYACLILSFNLLADILQGWLDPRARAK